MVEHMFDTRSEQVWLDHLNEAQRAAVLHDGGPLLVVAGAGSGKTRTLASRVARLIDEGTPADRILLLTFTRRAASEMLRRAGALIVDRSAGQVWGGTFHGTANRLLRRHGAAVGLGSRFTVIDQTDSATLLGRLRTEHGLGSTGRRFPKKETIAAIYSRTVNTRLPLEDTLNDWYPWVSEYQEDLGGLFRAYTSRKRETNVLDYDDLLLYWHALLDSPAAAAIRGLFDHVLVDEYQDTNRSQAQILSALGNRNITVVGDDAQSIYSFRGANVENILGFCDDFPGTTVVKLEQNFRSTPQILEAANSVIGASKKVFPKHLWSERRAGPKPALVTCFDESAQADFVADRVLELREEGIALRDQAVLFRTGHHSAGLEIELSRRNIPFIKFGGLRFLEAAHIKDMVSLLRILDNAYDELAWDRVLQAMPGVGPSTAMSLTSRLDELVVREAGDRLAAFIGLELSVPAEAAQAYAVLRACLADCRGTSGAECSPAEQIERLADFCELVFERNYDDAAARLADLGQLAALATKHSDRSSFLTELTLDPPLSTSDLAGPPHLDEDYLILSTIHSAKGGEWAAVYVIHAADGNIPSDMALNDPGGLEEERRLLYVALTRAKDHLVVTVPQRFYHHRFSGSANHSYALPSRFLEPAGAAFEASAAGGPAIDEEAVITTSGPDPVHAMLEKLW